MNRLPTHAFVVESRDGGCPDDAINLTECLTEFHPIIQHNSAQPYRGMQMY